MFGFIKGIIDEIMPDSLMIDNHGVGWQIFVPANVLDRDVHVGDEVKLHTYLSVSENALALYGFFTRDDLEMYKMLLNVSGIGPKGALGVLSVMSADDLRFAILADDAAAISKAPGIGKKTAQKLILELKDKLNLEDAFEKKLTHADEDAGAVQKSGGTQDASADAVSALVALGYSSTEAYQAVRKVSVGEGMDSEKILRAALKFIF